MIVWDETTPDPWTHIIVDGDEGSDPASPWFPLTGVLFGLLPAIQASRPDVVPVLKNEAVPAGIGRRGFLALFGMRQTLVIGVARNAKYNGVAEDPIPFIYQPLRQNYSPGATLHVRAAGNASALTTPVRQMVQKMDVVSRVESVFPIGVIGYRDRDVF